jgi:hypothetical protein
MVAVLVEHFEALVMVVRISGELGAESIFRWTWDVP